MERLIIEKIEDIEKDFKIGFVYKCDKKFPLIENPNKVQDRDVYFYQNKYVTKDTLKEIEDNFSQEAFDWFYNPHPAARYVLLTRYSDNKTFIANHYSLVEIVEGYTIYIEELKQKIY